MTFEETLRKFFKENDPGRSYLAPRMAKEFMRDKQVVLTYLAEKYAKGPVEYKGRAPKKSIEAAAAPVAEMLEQAPEEVAEITENLDAVNEQLTDAVAKTADVTTEAATEAVEGGAEAIADAGELVEEGGKKKKGLFGKKKKKK